MKKILSALPACLLLLALTACSAQTKAERRIEEKTDLRLELSGCVVVSETDTHGWMGDGEYLLVLDCSDCREQMVEQTQAWRSCPLTDNLQTLLVETGLHGIEPIGSGAWFFCDRFPGEDPADRHADTELLWRGAYNFSLLMYDSEHSRLYYYEMDT